jgi:hypothetical protein
MLGLDTTKVARSIAADEKDRRILPTPGGRQRMSIVSESGLYKLILRAPQTNLAVAAFQDWVTREFLPATHKDGGYISRPSSGPGGLVRGATVGPKTILTPRAAEGQFSAISRPISGHSTHLRDNRRDNRAQRGRP